MARTNGFACARMEDVSEMSELMEPFLVPSLERQLTPYKIAILIILEQYTTYESAEEFSVDEKTRISLGFMRLFRSASRPLADLKRTICGEFQSPVLATTFLILITRASNMGFDLFTSMLYGCVATIVYGDGKVAVKSTSLTGQFVRKLFLAYKKASFDDMCRLWADFRLYFSPDNLPPVHRAGIQLPSRPLKDIPFSLPRHDASNPNVSTNAGVSTETDRETVGLADSVDFWRTSEDYRSVIPSQKEALAFLLKQIFLLQHDSASALSYLKMNLWINETRRHLPRFHELFFLEYLNEQRIKNLPAAENALHHYIDCAGLALMSNNIFDFSSHRLIAPATSVIPMGAFRSLRYGPLLLADMHRRFGNEEKALAYLHECVKCAEEANDKVCLDYAVALFSMLNCASKRADYNRLVEQALKGTEDRSATTLHFRCHLAQLLKSISDCKNAKSLVDLKHLIFTEIHEKLPTVTISGKDRNTTERSIKNILKAAFSATYLQRGYWDVAILEAQKLIYSRSLITSDVRSIAVTHLAYGLAAKGQYDKAKTVLSDFKHHFAEYTPEFDRVNLADDLLNFETAFLAGDSEECKTILARIEALSPTEFRFRKATYDSARGTFDVAIDSMLQFLQTDEGRKPYAKCRALLVLGQLFLHRAAKVGIAQEYLIQCHQVATDNQFAHLATIAAHDLMEIKTVYVNLSKARTLLKKDAGGGLRGASRCVGLLGKLSKQAEAINVKLYQRQIYALLAIAYQRLGNTEERNRASKLYRQHHEKLKIFGFTALIF